MPPPCDEAIRFYGTYDARIDADVRALAADRVSLVVGDIAPLAFEVAARLGVPGVAIANFTWDWIYETHPGLVTAAPWLVPMLRASYAKATLALELPFAGGLRGLPHDTAIATGRATAHAHARRDARPLRDRGGPRGGPALVRRLRPARPRLAHRGLPWRLDGRDDRSRRRADRRAAVARADDSGRGVPVERVPIRGSGRGRGCGADQAGLRHPRGVHLDRHGHALHVARRLSGIRGADARHAEVRAKPVHLPRRSAGGPLGRRA